MVHNVESPLTERTYPDSSGFTRVVNQMTARQDAIVVTHAAGTVAIVFITAVGCRKLLSGNETGSLCEYAHDSNRGA